MWPASPKLGLQVHHHAYQFYMGSGDRREIPMLTRRARWILPLLASFTALADVASRTQYSHIDGWNASNPHTHDASGLFTVVTRLLASYYQQVFIGKERTGKKAMAIAWVSGFMSAQAFPQSIPI